MSIYDFYKDYCVCPGTQVYISMRDLDGEEVGSFPVYVYNVNEELIGFANTKQEYIDVWNTDSDNRAVGTLSGLIGPFSFTLTLKPGQVAPVYVIGANSLFSNRLIDSEGNFLVDDNGDFLTHNE